MLSERISPPGQGEVAQLVVLIRVIEVIIESPT